MKSTQFGWVTLAILLLLFIVMVYQISSREYLIGVSIFIFVLALLFYKLTISITDSQVSFKMGIGLIKGQYDLSQIEYCKGVTYFPLGFGIRLRPGIILYNVSGRKAIELKLKNKNRRIWIGTNSPDILADYINSQILDSPINKL